MYERIREKEGVTRLAIASAFVAVVRNLKLLLLHAFSGFHTRKKRKEGEEEIRDGSGRLNKALAGRIFEVGQVTNDFGSVYLIAGNWGGWDLGFGPGSKRNKSNLDPF